MRLYTVALLAACLLSSSQALAECGVASAYTQQNRPHAHDLKPADISAAHPSLPAGTRVIVRNQQKGRSIVVRIAGRSSFFSEGIIDLSPGALHALGMDASSIAPVCLEVVSYGSQNRGFEKPSVLRGLLEAFAPKRRHYAANVPASPSAKARIETRSAKARIESRSAKAKTGTRSAKAAHHRRRHYASARHGSGKRYAKLNRRSRSMRRKQGVVRLSRR